MDTSSEFDDTLDRTHALLLQMAARIERQIGDAVACLGSAPARRVEQVLARDTVIHDLRCAVDALAGRAIARRDPATCDLRLLVALIKSTAELERIGDEAKKIALKARHVAEANSPMGPRHRGLASMAQLALQSVRAAINALERLDTDELASGSARGPALAAAAQQVLRELIDRMIEDPRRISSCLDTAFVANSLDRIGDHAANILETLNGLHGTCRLHGRVSEK